MKPAPKLPVRTAEQLARDLSNLQREMRQLEEHIAEVRHQEPIGICRKRGYHNVLKSEGRPVTPDYILARLTCKCGAEADVLLKFDEGAPKRWRVDTEFA